MRHYRLFGGLLQSDVTLPDVQNVAAGPASWTLATRVVSAPLPDGDVLATEQVTAKSNVTLSRIDGGFRLRFEDTGCFDVTDHGRRIRWHRPVDVVWVDACVDITSRVMALALHAAGTLCLHGSAVAWGDHAIGFIAPKFHGKSTLALASVRAGARLLTDDTLPVEPGPPALAWPGLPVARLWSDSAERMGPMETRLGADDKVVYPSLPQERVAAEGVRLDALYVLAPDVNDRNGAAAWRARIAPMEAALLVLGNAKLAPLLRGSELPVLFDRATTLASHVPVFRLGLVRSFDRLEEVVGTLAGWHVGTQALTGRRSGAA